MDMKEKILKQIQQAQLQKEKEMHDFWFGVNQGSFYLKPIQKEDNKQQNGKRTN